MNLKDLAKIIFAKGTASENRRIRVVHFTNRKELWSGKAHELSGWDGCSQNWIVVEVLVDYNDDTILGLSSYNRGKIITVI